MAKIITFPKSKRRILAREGGERLIVPHKALYRARLRVHLPVRGREAAEDRLYPVLLRQLHKLGGFTMAKGFTLEAVRSGDWIPWPRRARSGLVKKFLMAVDHDCAEGFLEVEVDGVLMSRSRTAA
ncbi:hypothetical protein LAZ40_02355 [Cereibacter sphaeroides]|uniref:hypothetical protein n=1 Tax=Cereibacter sphaeroides TaxID=1063 RepID=UPI001F3C9E09|nr:hypothetical protein [Cereibacter sphaeroides]MCE6957900.1 hypothetical protein [Cereibacter sphaeroides]MCE6971752.1 hypothetical protein [Cereibacter sphaeroides]